MAIDHTKCSVGSRLFCDELLTAIRSVEPTAFRNQTSNCGFGIEGENRFAYLYHKTDSSLATIFLRGDEPDLIPALSNGASVELREKLTGNWAREFPLFIHVPPATPVVEVAELLLTFSRPLAARKRASKEGRDRINDTVMSDGKIRTILSTRYERSQTLRAMCLQHYTYRCVGCDLLMAERYGKIAEQLIHVHHLERLADTGERPIDPKKDLVPLCPNCHSVVHLKTPPMSIADLRTLLRQNATDPSGGPEATTKRVSRR